MANLHRILQGMSSQEAAELLERIEGVLTTADQALSGKQFNQGIEDSIARIQGKERTPGGNWRYPYGQEPPEAPKPFDGDGANRRIDQLSAEYERLSENPYNNVERMDQISAEINQLRSTFEREVRTARQAQIAPELQTLQADMENIAAEINQLTQNPDRNYARIEKLQGQLDARLSRSDALRSGSEIDTLPLQWKGGEE